MMPGYVTVSLSFRQVGKGPVGEAPEPQMPWRGPPVYRRKHVLCRIHHALPHDRTVRNDRERNPVPADRAFRRMKDESLNNAFQY